MAFELALGRSPCLISLGLDLKICHLVDQLISFLGCDPCLLTYLLFCPTERYAVRPVPLVCVCLLSVCPGFLRTIRHAFPGTGLSPDNLPL